MILLYATLGYILSIGFWAKPLIDNATMTLREVGAAVREGLARLRRPA
jgi:hypothetical protein